MKLVLVSSLALLAAGCVSFRFDRATVNLPPRPGAAESLELGKATIADALQALGAPVFAWEWKEDGMALAWGWSEDTARGITLSVPLDKGSARASYDDLARHLRGVVLFFDAETRLVELREGALNDFREAHRRRPAPVE